MIGDTRTLYVKGGLHDNHWCLRSRRLDSQQIRWSDGNRAWSTKYIPRWKDWWGFGTVPRARHGLATPAPGLWGAQEVEKTGVREGLA